MNRLNKYAVVAAGLGLALTGCEDLRRAEFPNFEASLLELAQQEPDLSTFVQLADESGFDAVLESPASQITVFAPTDAAFSALDAATLQMLRDDIAELNRVLRFHTAAGIVGPTLLRVLPEVTTITEGTVAVSEEGDTFVLAGTSRIVEVGIQGDNGLIHKIDTVLDAGPGGGPGTIVDVATASGLTDLVDALEATGLDATLMMAGPFTVFAPTNDAFGALDLTPVDSAIIANTLLTHVVPGSLDSAAVTSTTSLMTAANTPIAVDASSTPVTVGGAALSEDASRLDVEADNGIVHVVDDVILPPTTTEVAADTPALSTLVAAVTAAPAAIGEALDPDTLMGEMPITVFAPTNDAFEAAGIDPATTSSTALATVLSNHVVMGQTLSSALMNGDTITTLAGTTTVAVEGESIFILDGAGQQSEIIIEDIRTRSGVVHVVDLVLVP